MHNLLFYCDLQSVCVCELWFSWWIWRCVSAPLTGRYVCVYNLFTHLRSLRYSSLHHNCQRCSVSSEALLTKPLLLSVSLRMSIVSIVAREILDSRGNPTVEVDLRTEKGERRRGMKNNMMFPPAMMSAQIHLVRKALRKLDGATASLNRSWHQTTFIRPPSRSISSRLRVDRGLESSCKLKIGSKKDAFIIPNQV